MVVKYNKVQLIIQQTCIAVNMYKIWFIRHLE